MLAAAGGLVTTVLALVELELMERWLGVTLVRGTVRRHPRPVTPLDRGEVEETTGAMEAKPISGQVMASKGL